MSKVRKGRQSIRKVLEVPDEIFRQAVNLPKAERYEYISLECATVIARLIKELRIKQGRGIRVNFYCIDMKDYKYFGFSTRNRQLENCQFLIEGKRYTFFLSVDNKNSYGVQNDDYLRILAISLYFIVCIRNAISETPGIFLVGKRESDVCILGYNCIYNSVSVPCVQPQFFSIGCTVNHHRQLFKCKGMAAQADTKHQSMLSLSAKIFCSRLPQSEIGYSTKNLYRLFGLLPYWAAIF